MEESALENDSKIGIYGLKRIPDGDNRPARKDVVGGKEQSLSQVIGKDVYSHYQCIVSLLPRLILI